MLEVRPHSGARVVSEYSGTAGTSTVSDDSPVVAVVNVACHNRRHLAFFKTAIPLPHGLSHRRELL